MHGKKTAKGASANPRPPFAAHGLTRLNGQ